VSERDQVKLQKSATATVNKQLEERKKERKERKKERKK
jgi:hypothetical protein